jgi:hypothetical protein
VTTEKSHVLVAISEARRLVNRVWNGKGCVDIYAVAKELGVESIEAAPLHVDGYLAKCESGKLGIRYRIDNSYRRNRFTIAHELGHILLAAAQGVAISERCRDFERNPAEEVAVSRIGSELLMPERKLAFEISSGRYPSAWDFIRVMRHAFDVSESAMALRMLELWSVGTVLVRLNVDCATPVRGSTFPVDVSQHKLLRVAESGGTLVERLERDRQRSRLHSIRAELSGKMLDLKCEGNLRNIPGKNGLVRQYWVLGWITSERRIAELCR